MNENLNNEGQLNTEPTNPVSEEPTNSVSEEPTNSSLTNESPSNSNPKKSKKGLLIAVIFILLVAAVLAVYMLLIKNDEDKETGNVACFDVEGIEQINCISDSINDDNFYNRETLLNNGFNEIDIDINTNGNIVESLSNLEKITTTNKVEISSRVDGKKLALIELNNGVVTLSYYSKEEVATKQQTISDVVSMSYEKDLGVYDRYVFLVDSDGDCHKLHVNQVDDVNKIYNDQFTGLLFEKVTTVSDINEVYYLFNHSTTSGVDISYLVKTKDNAYKYIDDGKVYDPNTYKVISENGKIMNNRDVYLNEEIQSYKFKMEYTDGALKGKVQYILTADNYLYDAKLGLVYDKKVSSILVKDYYVITIFEDGKNIGMDSVEI